MSFQFNVKHIKNKKIDWKAIIKKVFSFSHFIKINFRHNNIACT